MNENPLAAPPAPPLACSKIVYRAAMDESWFSKDASEVDAAAFFKRGRHDSHGLSVGLTEYAYRRYLSGPVAGVISVHVGHVRDVRDAELKDALDVVIDDAPHGNITNIPDKPKSGPRRKLAERIASQLAKTAARVHLVFDPPHN
jgi:hypothetical protein